jgi:hypothetical protein
VLLLVFVLLVDDPPPPDEVEYVDLDCVGLDGVGLDGVGSFGVDLGLGAAGSGAVESFSGCELSSTGREISVALMLVCFLLGGVSGAATGLDVKQPIVSIVG